ncbi:E3 ubiquitin-protein ligase TRIM21-like [Pseudophryne corroboree]|uniref:E3 ubiquitin-protein ligase TRIM21-like n=1 Tax=Pseudophryne corroboree TaxID=495146 RepID=UPI003081D370
MASADLKAELSCSICLSTYTDPVSLRCGHNFCQDCIVRVLDTQEEAGGYSCPECRAEYQERPALEKNRKLRNIVERFSQSQDNVSEEEGKVFCLYCVDSPVLAAKTCVQCETSLCDTHLQAHNKALNHLLTEPTKTLEHRKCSIHKERLQYYCSKDAACVCETCCLAGEHRGCNIRPINEAFMKRKRKILIAFQKHNLKQQRIQETLKTLPTFKKKVQKESIAAKKKINLLFTHINKEIRNLKKECIDYVNSQKQTICYLSKQLETRRGELSTSIQNIRELYNTSDPLTGLQDRAIDRIESVKDDELDRSLNRLLSNSVARDEAIILMSASQRLFNIVSKDVMRKYDVPENSVIQLLGGTTGNRIAASDGGRLISCANINQNHPENLERVNDCPQVLSKSSFSSGRHIWTVGISECGLWRVGAAYASIVRQGVTSLIGSNNKSWCVMRNKGCFTAVYANEETKFYPKASLHNLIIDLDYEAGRLSFYQLCDPIRHLHTFSTTFSEPLHAAFYVSDDAWIKIME